MLKRSIQFLFLSTLNDVKSTTKSEESFKDLLANKCIPSMLLNADIHNIPGLPENFFLSCLVQGKKAFSVDFKCGYTIYNGFSALFTVSNLNSIYKSYNKKNAVLRSIGFSYRCPYIFSIFGYGLYPVFDYSPYQGGISIRFCYNDLFFNNMVSFSGGVIYQETPIKLHENSQGNINRDELEKVLCNLGQRTSLEDEGIFIDFLERLYEDNIATLYIFAPSGTGKSALIRYVEGHCKVNDYNFGLLNLQGVNIGGYTASKGQEYFHDLINKILDKATSYNAACKTVFCASEFIKTFKDVHDTLRAALINSLLLLFDGTLDGLHYKGTPITKEKCAFKFILDDSCSTILRETNNGVCNDVIEEARRKIALTLSNYSDENEKKTNEIKLMKAIALQLKSKGLYGDRYVDLYRLLYKIYASFYKKDVISKSIMADLAMASSDAIRMKDFIMSKFPNADLIKRGKEISIVGTSYNIRGLINNRENNGFFGKNWDLLSKKNALSAAALLNGYDNPRKILFSMSRMFNNKNFIDCFPCPLTEDSINSDLLILQDKEFKKLNLNGFSENEYRFLSTNSEFWAFMSSALHMNFLLESLLISGQEISDEMLNLILDSDLGFMDYINDNNLKNSKAVLTAFGVKENPDSVICSIEKLDLLEKMLSIKTTSDKNNASKSNSKDIFKRLNCYHNLKTILKKHKWIWEKNKDKSSFHHIQNDIVLRQYCEDLLKIKNDLVQCYEDLEKELLELCQTIEKNEINTKFNDYKKNELIYTEKLKKYQNNYQKLKSLYNYLHIKNSNIEVQDSMDLARNYNGKNFLKTLEENNKLIDESNQLKLLIKDLSTILDYSYYSPKSINYKYLTMLSIANVVDFKAKEKAGKINLNSISTNDNSTDNRKVSKSDAKSDSNSNSNSNIQLSANQQEKFDNYFSALSDCMFIENERIKILLNPLVTEGLRSGKSLSSNYISNADKIVKTISNFIFDSINKSVEIDVEICHRIEKLGNCVEAFKDSLTSEEMNIPEQYPPVFPDLKIQL